MEKILIIHTWGLGDWLFFTPVIRAIKQAYPFVSIEVILGAPRTRQIVELYPEVHIRAVADMSKGPCGMVKAALRTWPTKYDALIFTIAVDSRKANRFAPLVRARKKVALCTTPEKHHFLTSVAMYDASIHRVENGLKILGLLGIEYSSDLEPFLPFKEAVKPTANSVLIHPGCNVDDAYRRWPAERFARVAEALLAQGRQASIILGPAEVGLAESFSYLEGQEGFRLYQDLSLKEALRIISQYEILLNSDSGLGHIAAALGRRVVTIFGPGDPRKVRPWSKNSMVIQSTGELSCMPCMRPGGKYGCELQTCLADINVEDVLAVL